PASLDHGTTHLVQYAELFLNKSIPPLVGRWHVQVHGRDWLKYLHHHVLLLLADLEQAPDRHPAQQSHNELYSHARHHLCEVHVDGYACLCSSVTEKGEC